MLQSKRVVIIGGTGFLGQHAAREFLRRGWQVTAIGLPPARQTGAPAGEITTFLIDLEKTSRADLLKILRGHEALVFAAGMDDRVLHKKPAYPQFHHANVEMPVRILKLAKEAGIDRAVVLGSYFAHFHRLWPQLELARHHPYIRSRVEQENTLTSLPGMDVRVLELPYIFGEVPGGRPLWYPLVQYMRKSPILFYMKGGSACITARTAGLAIVGAVEYGQAGKCYPIGDENLTWTELLRRLARADGRTVKIVLLPNWLVKAGLFGVWFINWLRGIEAGLDPRHFAGLQTAETFLDPASTKAQLGYETGGLDDAFQKTVQAC